VARNSPDLSFPVSCREQQRYLKLADLFLALDEEHSRSSNVIPLDGRGPQPLAKGRLSPLHSNSKHRLPPRLDAFEETTRGVIQSSSVMKGENEEAEAASQHTMTAASRRRSHRMLEGKEERLKEKAHDASDRGPETRTNRATLRHFL
jgi:hypothetical protein